MHEFRKGQLFVAEALLSNGAEKAKKIIADYRPLYPSIKAYFEDIDKMYLSRDAVEYREDGSIVVNV